MIAYLRGKILKKGQVFVILDIGGVGYQIFVNPPLYAEINVGEEKEFYIHQHIKDDAHDLYGFKNFSELEFFKLLISISGVGPKSALGVLAAADVSDIKASITQGDPTLLNKVSGIGVKTAERIVLELKNKIPHLSLSSKHVGSVHANSDEIDALIALGYSLQQARSALSQVDKNITDSGSRIRAALNNL